MLVNLFVLFSLFFCDFVNAKDYDYEYISNEVDFPDSSYSDALLNHYMDEFVRSPAVTRQPGFSILAKHDILVQNAMERQGISFDSLARIAQKQISSRQGIVGPLANIISSTGGARPFFNFAVGAAGAVGTLIQAGQISSNSQKIDERALSTDLTAAVARIAALETSVNTLSGSGTSSAAELKAICTTVTAITAVTGTTGTSAQNKAVIDLFLGVAAPTCTT